MGVSFIIKLSGEVRYKARWVVIVKGNIMNGHDLEHHKDTYAPVVNPTTTLALLSVATHHGWTILQADAVLAFLNGELKELSIWPSREDYSHPVGLSSRLLLHIDSRTTSH